MLRFLLAHPWNVLFCLVMLLSGHFVCYIGCIITILPIMIINNLDRFYNPFIFLHSLIIGKRDEFENQKNEFTLCGYVARGQGVINKETMTTVSKKLFDYVGDDVERQNILKECFRNGKSEDYDPTDDFKELNKYLFFDFSRRRKIVEWLVWIAFADKTISDGERERLIIVSQNLHIPVKFLFFYINQCETMYRWSQEQNERARRYSEYVNGQNGSYYDSDYVSPSQLDSAFEILGIPKTDNIDEVKKAYRKLMRKYHPDRYANDSSISETTKKMYEEKAKAIQQAYDVICKHLEKK